MHEALRELEDYNHLLWWFAADCLEKGLALVDEEVEPWVLPTLRERSVQAAISEDQINTLSHHPGMPPPAQAQQAVASAVYAAINGAPFQAIALSSMVTGTSWQQARLAYLCEVWAICGARTPWMVWEGKCPIPEPQECKLQPSLVA